MRTKKRKPKLTRDYLERIAGEVRAEVAPDTAVDGDCQPVSDAIVDRLHADGHLEAYTLWSSYHGHPHAWVVVEPYNVDATRDQFAAYADEEEEESLLDTQVVVWRSDAGGKKRKTPLMAAAASKPVSGETAKLLLQLGAALKG